MAEARTEIFERQHQRTLPATGRGARLAYMLWLEYFIATEAFDRTQPGGWSPRSPEEWIPLSLGPSQDFARERYREAMSTCRVEGVAEPEIRRQREEAARLPYSLAVERLRELLGLAGRSR